jgi:predicted kinase
MNKPIAIILCGPPCIGKNTYIKNNKKYLHQFVPLSFDDYRYINGKYDFSNAPFSSVYESFKNDLNYYKELEIPIIINNVSVDNYSVLWFTSMLEDTYDIKLVFFKPESSFTLQCRNIYRWFTEGRYTPKRVIRNFLKTYKSFYEDRNNIRYSWISSEFTPDSLRHVISRGGCGSC